MNSIERPCTAFHEAKRLASGPLKDVALSVKSATDDGAFGILVFDDRSGRVIDINLEGSAEDVIERLTPIPVVVEKAGRGRPKLGVVAREVTLLPRHWEWLATQPGGASVALRKLVEEARRTSAPKDRARESQEAAYRFLSAMAGNRVGFEEAARALFAGDFGKLRELASVWPPDVASFAMQLAEGAGDSQPIP